VLPNAWDAPSALAYLADGFTAIGTTSFGVASSGGRRDGQPLPPSTPYGELQGRLVHYENCSGTT
jgi:2-methylisocitrate lyase-like PEP mutase family enzyme